MKRKTGLTLALPLLGASALALCAAGSVGAAPAPEMAAPAAQAPAMAAGPASKDDQARWATEAARVTI
ncbi:MAG: hypothetical protein KGL69_12805, partial [Alphaproteobacteria bacterium]|nr:hypothetical protein [Alphaproteobacteria bacterium]